MLTITAIIRAKKGHDHVMRAALLEVAGNVQANEPDTIGFFISQDVGDPCLFTTYERFTDQTAMDRHNGSGVVAKGQGGAFVAMSGVSTHVGTPNRCHVSASKAGLEGLMRALAVELAPHRITCNALSPGAIDTARAASAGPPPANRMNRPIPLKRFGTVDEIAAMVRLLVGPQGTFITGQTIHVNGGEFLT